MTMAIPPGQEGDGDGNGGSDGNDGNEGGEEAPKEPLPTPVPSAEPVVKPSPSAVPVVAEVTEEAPVRKQEKPAVPKPSLTPEPVLGAAGAISNPAGAAKDRRRRERGTSYGSGTAGGCRR